MEGEDGIYLCIEGLPVLAASDGRQGGGEEVCQARERGGCRCQGGQHITPRGEQLFSFHAHSFIYKPICFFSNLTQNGDGSKVTSFLKGQADVTLVIMPLPFDIYSKLQQTQDAWNITFCPRPCDISVLLPCEHISVHFDIFCGALINWLRLIAP